MTTITWAWITNSLQTNAFYKMTSKSDYEDWNSKNLIFQQVFYKLAYLNLLFGKCNFHNQDWNKSKWLSINVR